MSWTTEQNQDAYAAIAIVPCAGCGVMVGNPDDAAEAFCPACDTPPPARPACLLCGAPIYRGEGDPIGTRHRHCGAFIAALDARREAWKLAAAAALALAVLTGAGDALAAPGPTVTRDLPAGCELVVTFEDRSQVAECADGTSYGYEPTYRYWDRRDAYQYTGTDTAGVTHTITYYE